MKIYIVMDIEEITISHINASTVHRLSEARQNVLGTQAILEFDYEDNIKTPLFMETFLAETWYSAAELNAQFLSLPEWQHQENEFSLSFDGVDEYMTVADAAAFVPGQNFSISLWVKPAALTSTKCILSQFRESGKYSWAIKLNGTATTVSVVYSSSGSDLDTTTTTGKVVYEAWNHIVIAFDGAAETPEMNVYINGALSLGDTTEFSSLYNTDVPIVIGGLGDQDSTATDLFEGNMDSVVLYDKTLDSTEVAELSSLRHPINIMSFTSSANATAWWRMGDEYNGVSDPDEIAGNDAISVNMSISNKSTDVA